MRESPVAAEKIAVDHASRRRARLGSSTRASIGDGRAGRSTAAALLRIAAARRCGPFFAMPNIKQQKKRVRVAARQRLENLRYRSTVKTLTKRLETAVEDGDADAVAAEHRELVRLIDRAAARGALHKNTAARKKSQAARLVSGASLLALRLAAAALGRARCRRAPARARARRRAGCRPSARGRVARAGRPRRASSSAEKFARLREELLDVEGVHASAAPPRRAGGRPRRRAAGTRERGSTWLASAPASRGAARGAAAARARAAPRTRRARAPTSRCPQASVSAKVGVSRDGRDERSTSRSAIGSPSAQVASFSISSRAPGGRRRRAR